MENQQVFNIPSIEERMEVIALHGIAEDAFRPFDAVRMSDETIGCIGNLTYDSDGSLRIILGNSISVINEMAGLQTLYNVSMNQLHQEIGISRDRYVSTTRSTLPFDVYPTYQENYDEEDQIIK